MRVLLLGGGGREHALGWKLAQSRRLDQLVSVPGNPGLADLGPTVAGDPTDLEVVAELAADADVVIVGPEAPLAAGVVDRLARDGVPVFGPTQAAARLETSKSFAKEMLRRAAVPTAAAATFTAPEPALAHLAESAGPYVVKADGLAAGKGVLVTDDLAEATAWVWGCFDGRFGEAGRQVVIEEHLAGDEISVFGLADGTDVVGLRPARDYKRLGDGDAGPNTGGMGAFTPVPGFDDGWVSGVVAQMVQPVLDAMADAGSRYVGFIYAGLMLTDDGPKVLEFNCRLGDPETEVLLPVLDSDLLDMVGAALDGNVAGVRPRWSDRHAVDVVLAAAGYPQSPVKGDEITGLADQIPDTLVFHAGTRRRQDRIVTAGGRVLNVIGLGPDLATARSRAYERAEQIRFSGKQYRRDIAT